MKKSLLIVSSLLACVAGAVYMVAPLTLRGRTSSAASAKPSDGAGGSALKPSQDKFVAFHEQRVADQPNDAEARRLLAHALLERAKVTGDPADFDRAWTELDQGELLEPRSLRILRERADLSLSRHRFGLGRSLAEQGLERAPDDIQLLGFAGDGAVEMGDFASAEAYYRKRASLDPELPSTWVKFARSAEMQGNMEEAAGLMQKALGKAYAKPIAHDGIAWIAARCAEIAMKRGKLDEARQRLTTALQEKPDHPLALEFLANLDQWENKQQAAEADYRRLLALRPGPKIKLRLANLLEAQGRKDEAQRLRDESLRSFEKAVAGGFEGYLRDLATLDLAAGRYQRAAELAARDMALRPTVESRALYTGILRAAEEAGQPVKGFAPLQSQSSSAIQAARIAQ